MKTTFDITGMTCAACSARVQSAVEALDGAADVQVNLLTNSMAVEYDADVLTPSDIILKVKAAGYGAAVHDPHGKRAQAQEKAEAAKKRRLIVSVLLLLPLMYLSMGHMLGAYCQPQLFYRRLSRLAAVRAEHGFPDRARGGRLVRLRRGRDGADFFFRRRGRYGDRRRAAPEPLL